MVEANETTPAPLQGIRVLDLSRVVSGPLCGRILADLGADVVKVEPPELDRTRTVPPFIDGISPYFAQLNAGKRNVGIDLKAPGAPDLVRQLAAVCDVFVENFRPGVLARYGLDADRLLTINPRLVYCSLTGWGQDGPWRDRRAYAPLMHAETGMVEMAARVRGRRPESEVNQHGDVYPGILAANAVLAALLQRERTGRGQHLDVAMAQAMVYANEWSAVNMQPPPAGLRRIRDVDARHFPARRRQPCRAGGKSGHDFSAVGAGARRRRFAAGPEIRLARGAGGACVRADRAIG